MADVSGRSQGLDRRATQIRNNYLNAATSAEANKYAKQFKRYTGETVGNYASRKKK